MRRTWKRKKSEKKYSLEKRDGASSIAIAFKRLFLTLDLVVGKKFERFVLLEKPAHFLLFISNTTVGSFSLSPLLLFFLVELILIVFVSHSGCKIETTIVGRHCSLRFGISSQIDGVCWRNERATCD